MGLAAGVALATRVEACAVCRYPTVIRKPVYRWKPAAAEMTLYKSVWVHKPCRDRLIAGERPVGVKRRGLTPAEALDVVVRCEDLMLAGQVSHHPGDALDRTWSAYRQPTATMAVHRPLKRELRAARMPHAVKLERLTEAVGGVPDQLLTYENLVLTIQYMHSHSSAISDPMDVVRTLRDLRQRNRLHTLTPEPPDDGNPF